MPGSGHTISWETDFIYDIKSCILDGHLGIYMPEAAVESTISKFSDIEERLERVETNVAGRDSIWFKIVPVLISVLALIFSFGTTFVSYKRTVEQDTLALRGELRVLIQRLAALPKENLEALKKYADDPMSFALVSGFINQENNLLSKQAENLLNKLPESQISSTDYYAVSNALGIARNYDSATKFLYKSLEVANGLDDEVGALRNLAGLMFVTGRIGDGRATFQRALDVFGKYKGFDPFTIASTNIFTEISWAMAEASTNSFDLASQHLARADQIGAGLPAGPNSQIVKSQIIQARSQILSGASALPLAGAPAVLPAQGQKP